MRAITPAGSPAHRQTPSFQSSTRASAGSWVPRHFARLAHEHASVQTIGQGCRHQRDTSQAKRRKLKRYSTRGAPLRHAKRQYLCRRLVLRGSSGSPSGRRWMLDRIRHHPPFRRSLQRIPGQPGRLSLFILGAIALALGTGSATLGRTRMGRCHHRSARADLVRECRQVPPWRRLCPCSPWIVGGRKSQVGQSAIRARAWAAPRHHPAGRVGWTAQREDA